MKLILKSIKIGHGGIIMLVLWVRRTKFVPSTYTNWVTVAEYLSFTKKLV